MPVKAMARKKCLQCKKKAKWRGVCLGCYFAAKRRIQSGEVTDERLVRAGWWKAARKGPHGGESALKLDALLASAK